MSHILKIPHRFRYLVITLLLLAGSTLSSAFNFMGGSDRWTMDEREVLASMRLSQLPPVPLDPSNRIERTEAAIELGKQVFSDPRFSRNGMVSCASCHQPGKQFQDSLPFAQGVGQGTRRTMPLAGAAHSTWFFWDGRKDSLWSQALGPLEDAAEHGGNRMRYAHLLQANYRREYENLFGIMPDLSGLPRDASPIGSAKEQASWNAMSELARTDVSRIFANMGKAIAAYERRLTFGESRLDRYVEATLRDDPSAPGLLSADEKKGLRIFIGKGQCISCHQGPLLTDQHFHNTGIAPRTPRSPDQGRAAAVAAVRKDEFNCLGPYSDARPEQCEELRFLADDDPHLLGAFKTPSLRNVAERAPFMHAGQITSLVEAIDHYNRAPAAAVGHSELRPLSLSKAEVQAVAKFLHTLSGPVLEK